MKNFILTLCAIIPLGVFAQVQSPDASQIESDENVRLEKIDQKETVKETKKEKKAREKKMRELNEDIAYAKASNSMRRGYFVLLANSVDMGRRFTGLNEAANFVLVQDDDGIIPLLSQYSNFPDNGYKRVEDFLRIAFGEDSLTENINFVQESLGMTIEKYMQKEFWKYHKKMYQNRPIYWLFSSKKGAFQCLAYMHRMNAYTVEQIRSKYLLPHIEWLKNRITEMESRASSLKTNERRVKEQMEKDLTECLEYHDSLHLVADQQISFNLDDGVVKNYALFGNVLAKIK